MTTKPLNDKHDNVVVTDPRILEKELRTLFDQRTSDGRHAGLPFYSGFPLDTDGTTKLIGYLAKIAGREIDDNQAERIGEALTHVAADYWLTLDRMDRPTAKRSVELRRLRSVQAILKRTHAKDPVNVGRACKALMRLDGTLWLKVRIHTNLPQSMTSDRAYSYEQSRLPDWLLRHPTAVGHFERGIRHVIKTSRQTGKRPGPRKGDLLVRVVGRLACIFEATTGKRASYSTTRSGVRKGPFVRFVHQFFETVWTNQQRQTLRMSRNASRERCPKGTSIDRALVRFRRLAATSNGT